MLLGLKHQTPPSYLDVLTRPKQDLDDVGKDSYHHVSAATSDSLDSLDG